MVQVSVIIVNYNTFDFTYKCVTSILDKTRGITFEIIIVDNASINFDRLKLESLSKQVKVIINYSNIGFAKANNAGIKESCGSVILLLNNDTYLINDTISITYNCLVNNEQIGVIGCKLLNEDHSWQRSFYNFPSVKSQLKKLMRIKEKPVNGNKEQFVPWITGAFLMFKKSSLEIFPEHKLNDDFFLYCEDIQWGFNFKKNNLNAFYFPNGAIVHYQGKSSSHDSDFNKKLKFYYPNLMKLLKMEHGYLYAKTYFFLLVLIFLSDFKHNSLRSKVIPLLRILFNNKKT
jgi:hypothetical protein